MILLTKCYATVTPESAEDGDFETTGYEWEDLAFGFREMLEYIEHNGFCESSCFPARGETYEWLETGFSVTDYRTGEETNYTLHYSRKNDARSDKYWACAVKHAVRS